ncbi:ferrochelatase [Salinisphaera sp. PC39]|uniref:ferrochelatase n=1 Tax=Salinisphaera sp. PC39 TaxID=1304156 RepID=UPI00333EF5B5
MTVPNERDAPLGVLLTNLGTPESPEPGDVRRYLAEFLGDPRVVEAPRWLWLPLLYGVILTTRPKKSAEAYAKIWWDSGSPLLVIARRQCEALQQRLDADLSRPVHVALAMRYGRPSLAQGLEELRDAGAERILLLPMYPQYSATTTATTFDRVTEIMRRWRSQPALRTVTHYHDEPAYIRALADSVRRHWDTHGRGERLMLSYHGIPKRYVKNGDPYPRDCGITAQLLAAELGLSRGEWKVCFQSRFGREPWLQPYTDKTLEAWGRDGVRSVDVLCPGFSADCLETLEEIAIGNRELFEENGGERLSYIPALNDDPAHIDMLAGIVTRELGGWL